MRQVSRAEAERLGGATPRPPRDEVEWANPRTGKTALVDRGLDPAWASNPGRDRQRILADRLAGTLDSAGEALAAEAVRLVVDSPLLEQQLSPLGGAPRGDLPVALLDRQWQQAMGSKTRLVRMTPRTGEKQALEHGDLSPDAYRQVLPAVLSGARLVIRETAAKGGIEGDLVFVAALAGKTYKAVLAARGERYVRLKTFHRGDESTARSARERGDAIRDLPAE